VDVKNSAPSSVTDDPRPELLGGDRRLSVVATLLFCTALGMVGVAAPLAALHVGITATVIGILVALAGASQMATRLCMGPLLRRFPDKHFVALAAIALVMSCALLVVNTAIWAFTVSQLLQGLARALFWTGSQTHAVRAWPTAVGGLAVLNVANSAGALVGPALAGVLAARSLQLSLLVAAVVGTLGVLPAAMLTRLRPFQGAPKATHAGARRMWRRPGVDAGCAMTAGGGAWRGLMNSYVPVVLAQAGQAAPAIGALVTVGNVAALVGSASSKWVQPLGSRSAVLIGLIPAGIGIALTGVLPQTVAVVAAALLIAGLGGGILQTVGPALAADSVAPEERGDAIASNGTFRAATLLITPLGVGALVLAMPIGVALGIAGAVMLLPGLVVTRTKQPVTMIGPSRTTREGH
jgi:MFS family permease